MTRSRFVYFILIAAVIAAGLASRHYSDHLPEWNKLYLGDALWAMMVFFIVGWLFPRKSKVWVAIGALAFSYAVEFSQIYHAPWIDAIRNTWIGGLVLGYGFLWSDILCYTAGIGAGLLLEVTVLKNKTES